MWEEKNKNRLYLNSKFRINNLDYLYVEKKDTKECFSAIKIILRLAKKYNHQSVEKIILLFKETSQCIDFFINKLKTENKKFGQLEKFNAEINKNDFERSCAFASGALKEILELNNTYNSKSSSSKNKITLEDIKSILNQKGSVSVYEKSHQFFNAGKTSLDDHKELVFITKVGE